VDEACHTYERAMWMRHVTHMNESCGWSMSHIWTSHMTCFIYMWNVAQTCAWHDSSICVTWLIHMWNMAHTRAWHDLHICVACLVHVWNMTHYAWHDSLCVTWLIHMCDKTHSYLWQDLFICATWLIHMGDMTHSYVWHDSFICVTGRIHIPIQGGKKTKSALSWKSLSAKKPLLIGIFSREWPVKIRHPMHFRRSVSKCLNQSMMPPILIVHMIYHWHDAFICSIMCDSSSPIFF